MPLEGLHLGHYRLLRLLGSGGMGEVYLAEDARIGQQVAIKVIRAEGLASPGSNVPKEAVRLFEREAKAIARLDHPNILPLYAYGEEMLNDIQLTYLVMPYRKEGTLASWLRQRGGSTLLSPAEVAPLLQQAANALQHAHDQQIIHQDVKPTNFLIRLRSDRPHRPDVLLADFGIAKLTSTTASISQSVRGTPIYMAPEQWDGHPVPATDQYALAIMVYELLVGRPPFRGGFGQIMHQHYMTPPPAPSTFNPHLSAAIDAVLLHALAKHPEERFTSMSDFARAFRQAVQSSRELPTAEEPSRLAARSETPPLLAPTFPPPQVGRAVPTVMPTNATSLPTEPVTPARKTPFPAELARSTTPSAAHAIPRGNRAQQQKLQKRGRRRFPVVVVNVLGIGAIVILIITAIGYGLHSYFNNNGNSAGPNNTAADFLVNLKSQTYDQAYKDLDATITGTLHPQDFLAMAQANDHCFGPITDFNEVAGSVIVSADGNTQSFTYSMTRSMLANPYQLTLTLQKVADGTWDITKFVDGNGTPNDLGPAPPAC